jgi:hypothetical protein
MTGVWKNDAYLAGEILRTRGEMNIISSLRLESLTLETLSKTESYIPCLLWFEILK